jgi:NTE family protein
MQCNVLLNQETGEISEETPVPLIEYLTFKGGGVRCVAYAGAIEVLADAGILANVKGVAGSSGGALTAMLLAIGCTPDEIAEYLKNLPYEEFLEGKDPSSTLQLILTYYRKLSLASGKGVLEWIEDKIEKKLGNKRATFQDLARLVEQNPQKYKNLYVTASNIDKNRLEVFSAVTARDVPISGPTFASMCYPIVFKPFVLGGCRYVDGGLMNNLPYYIFNNRVHLRDCDFNDMGVNPKVLNFKIETEQELKSLHNNYELIENSGGMVNFGIALLYGMQSRDGEISEQIPTFTVQIPDHKIGTFEKLTPAQIELLVQSGRMTTLTRLRDHVHEAYKLKVYPNEAAWLASKKHHELLDIKEYYMQELQRASRSFDPTTEDYARALQDKIATLTKYIDDFARATNHPTEKVCLEVSPHLDIKIKSPCAEIDKKVIEDLHLRLDFVEKKINYLTRVIEDTKEHISNKIDRDHDSAAFQQVVYVSLLDEELKMYKHVRHELLFKLNVPDKTPNLDRHLYDEFKSHVREFYQNHPACVSHANLIQFLDNQFAHGVISVGDADDVLSFDLRKPEDLQIYMMACMLYLSFIGNHEAEVVQQVQLMYKNLFSQTEVPTSLAQLSVIFREKHGETLIKAYKIERLIRLFASIDLPKEKIEKKFDTLTLDHVFATLSDPKRKWLDWFKQIPKHLAPLINDKDKSKEREMDFCYQPFLHSENFLLFKKIEKNTEVLEHGPRSKLTQGPKHMRRLE